MVQSQLLSSASRHAERSLQRNSRAKFAVKFAVTVCWLQGATDKPLLKTLLQTSHQRRKPWPGLDRPMHRNLHRFASQSEMAEALGRDEESFEVAMRTSATSTMILLQDRLEIIDVVGGHARVLCEVSI